MVHLLLKTSARFITISIASRFFGGYLMSLYDDTDHIKHLCYYIFTFFPIYAADWMTFQDTVVSKYLCIVYKPLALAYETNTFK